MQVSKNHVDQLEQPRSQLRGSNEEEILVFFLFFWQ